MSAPILATKLYIPPPRPGFVPRLRLVERLNECLATGCWLTLISAPAGFGKTTLVSEWIASCGMPVAWLSLDEGDNDPARFISYLVKALQMIQARIGEGLLAALQSPQPLQIETILTTLLNEISTIPENFLLVLDDYHSIDSQPVDQSLAFLIERRPPQMHLLIATREDPDLPLARLRARGQLTELRAADLRFTPAEAAEFLNRVMGLDLSDADVAALETRTEGWIAGLQLAAISMRDHKYAAGFIQSFTGSHRFVMDYLLEEVLHQQPESIQAFLLRTSVLDRMCGPLCDSVLLDPSISGQATLEYLERAEPRDTQDDVDSIIKKLSAEHSWDYLGKQGQRIHQVLGEVDEGDNQEAFEAWQKYLETHLELPFEADISESQERGPLHFSDRVTVTGFEGMEDLYGILVNINAGGSTYVFPRCDLKAADKISANYTLTDDYAVWFANR